MEAGASFEMSHGLVESETLSLLQKLSPDCKEKTSFYVVRKFLDILCDLIGRHGYEKKIEDVLNVLDSNVS